MITHDVDEAVLLSDKIVMMTNGPSATIGEVLDIQLARRRNRVELAQRSTISRLSSVGIEVLIREAITPNASI